jgi:hypothetical protein
MTAIRLLVLVVFFPAPAFAQTEPPWDNSDTEMRALFTTFSETVPCGTGVTGLCEEALALLRGGGDRLAEYLIRQPEPPFPNPYRVSRWSYIRYVGATESETAVNYLTLLAAEEARKLEADPATDPLAFHTALEGLANTRDLRALAVADDMLERFPNDPHVRWRSVRIMEHVQWKHGVLPEVQARFAEIAAEAPAVRAAAGADTALIGAEDQVQRLVTRIRTDPNAMKP